MARKPVPTPLSLAGLPAGSDPFMRIRETNLPDVARYWREQQAYGLATLGQLSTEEVSDAIRSKKAEPLFQSVVTMSTDAVYFSERGSDSRVRIVRREFESGKESVIWVASDQRWPLKMQLSPDKKRMAILLSGTSSDILLTPVSDEEAEPVLLKDADSGSAMLWMDGGSSFVYQPRRDPRLTQELHYIRLGKNSLPAKVIKRWEYHQDLTVTVAAQREAKGVLTWVETDAEGRLVNIQSANAATFEKNAPVWNKQKTVAGKMKRLLADQSTFLVLENGQRQIWELSGPPRKIWQDDQGKSSLICAVGGKSIWVNGQNGDLIRINSEGKQMQRVTLPESYKADVILPVQDRIAVFMRTSKGGEGWAILQDGRQPEWLQLPSVSDLPFVGEWRGRQVWPKHKTAGLRIVTVAGQELDGKQPVLLTTQLVADAEMPLAWRGWLKRGGVIAQLDIRKVSSGAVVSVIDEAVNWLVREGLGTSGVAFYAVSDQKQVMEYLLRAPEKISAAFVSGLPDLQLAGDTRPKVDRGAESANGDLYSLLRRDKAYPGLWLNSSGADDAAEHLKLIGAMQLLTRGVRPQFRTQGVMKDPSSEEAQAKILAFLLWQTGGLNLKSVPPAGK